MHLGKMNGIHTTVAEVDMLSLTSVLKQMAANF